MNTCTPAPPKDEAAIKNGLIGKLCNKCINTMVKIENPRKKSITSNLCSITVIYLIQLFNSSGEANQTTLFRFFIYGITNIYPAREVIFHPIENKKKTHSFHVS